MRFFLKKVSVFLGLMLVVAVSHATVNPAVYGVPVPGASVVMHGADKLMDSLLAVHPQLSSKVVISDIMHPHTMEDRTMDFYLLLFLCFMLGIIRSSDRRYFHNLWRAFRNPTLSSRQLKEQLQSASVPNLLMNIFFTIVGGVYIFYVVRLFTPQRSGIIAPSLLLTMLVGGIMVIYLAKYAAIKFSGWAFRVEGVTDYYIFNVFLINKIIAIMLLPFIMLIAFVDPVWREPIIILSFFVVGLLLINRYIRSWQVFGSFFQYSKFHFFTYLCASELLPLAVLMKLLVRGFLFY